MVAELMRWCRRRWAVGLLATVTTLAFAAIAAQTGTARPSRAACGSELWSLKTLSDPQRGLVNLRARNTTVAAIDARPMPHPAPATRSTAYERQVWRLKAQVVEFKLEADDDIHLVVFEQGHYMIAEMPLATCLPTATRDRRAIVVARSRLVATCGPPTSEWQSLGAVAYISGVGFWDFPHGQHGHAPNYVELHPVTGFKLVSGCGR